MNNNFITDNEIDRILGRITEYRKETEKKAGVDRHNISVEEKARLREEYTRKKAQEFATNFSRDIKRSIPIKEEKTNTVTNTTTPRMSTFTSAGVSAGLIRRVYAFSTDLCIVGLTLVGFVYGAMHFFGIDAVNKTSVYGVTSVSWLLGGLYAFLFLFYLVYFEGLIGQTPGKMFLNIKIVNSENIKPSFSTMMLRMFIFLIPPLGLFGLHNVITKTRLVMND
ncbi:MAG: RDD family protein [bacterium]